MRAFNDQLDQVVLLLLVLGGVVNEPHDELKQLHNCDDGGAKDHRAQVATHHGPQPVKQPAEAGARATLLLAAAGRVGAHVPVGDGVRHGGIRSRTNQLDRPQNAVDVRRHEKCLHVELFRVPHVEEEVKDDEAVDEDTRLHDERSERPEHNVEHVLEHLGALLDDGDEARDAAAVDDEQQDVEHGDDDGDGGEDGVHCLVGLVGGREQVGDGAVEHVAHPDGGVLRVVEPACLGAQVDADEDHDDYLGDEEGVDAQRGKKAQEDCPDEGEDDRHRQAEDERRREASAVKEPFDEADGALDVRGVNLGVVVAVVSLFVRRESLRVHLVHLQLARAALPLAERGRLARSADAPHVGRLGLRLYEEASN
mmetsp:Transcript_50192/g.108765  ORF Transcript_50192/g.108765 Transcript_50192/m.108765 type:complete len:367 (-) Transcript_50192:648-1748(-)